MTRASCVAGSVRATAASGGGILRAVDNSPQCISSASGADQSRIASWSHRREASCGICRQDRKTVDVRSDPARNVGVSGQSETRSGDGQTTR